MGSPRSGNPSDFVSGGHDGLSRGAQPILLGCVSAKSISRRALAPGFETFGGPDGKTLYVTARMSLYAVPMLVTGHWHALGEVRRAVD
jgi:hypothetical protein